MAAYTDMSVDSYDQSINYKYLKPGNPLTINLQDSTGKNLPNISLYFQGSHISKQPMNQVRRNGIIYRRVIIKFSFQTMVT
jgi:hypothetical protein